MLLQGRIALVTGGGRGIGRGIVDRFLDEGARVAVVQRRPLDAALEDHREAAHIRADLSDPSSITTAVEHVVERFGGLDIVVNNAGIMFERDISDITVAEWDLTVALNLRAPLFLTQAALPHMRARGGGSVINIGSIEGSARITATRPTPEYLLAEVGFYGQTSRESMMRNYEAAHGYEDGENLGFDTEELFPLYTVLKKSHDIVETLPDGSRKIRLECQTCNRDFQLKEERFMKLLYGLDEADPLKPSHSIDIAHIPG